MSERMKAKRLEWWKEQQRSGKLGDNFECLIRDFQTERDHIATLETQLAEVKKCDMHEFINYKPNLDGRKFYEVDDITAIIDKSSK